MVGAPQVGALAADRSAAVIELVIEAPRQLTVVVGALLAAVEEVVTLPGRAAAEAEPVWAAVE